MVDDDNMAAATNDITTMAAIVINMMAMMADRTVSASKSATAIIAAIEIYIDRDQFLIVKWMKNR